MKKSYEEKCKELGMKAEIGFVKFSKNGAVGFTCGKPDEIKALGREAIDHGYKLSAGLRRTLEVL